MNEGQACLRSLTFETTQSKMDQLSINPSQNHFLIKTMGPRGNSKG